MEAQPVIQNLPPPPPPPPPKGGKKGWMIAGIIIAVVVCCLCIASIVGTVVFYPGWFGLDGVVDSVSTTNVNVVGNWRLYYDWGCTGSEQMVELTINPDGTFDTAESSGGTWGMDGNQITLLYGTGTRYTGLVSQGTMNGQMVGFDNDDGCWRAESAGP